MVYGLATLVLAAIAAASITLDIRIAKFTSDVSTIANIHPFSGILSNLGIYLWCISASTCVFSAMILHSKNQTEHFWFLMCSALLSTYLMLDDAFLFHEFLLSRYFDISETVVFGILSTTVLAYLIVFTKVILKTQYISLVLAIAFLSLSVLIDTILGPLVWRLGHFGHWKIFLEDGPKWLGIVSWCIYYVQTSFRFSVHEYQFPYRANLLNSELARQTD